MVWISGFLVGCLEHQWIIFSIYIYIPCHHPNWRTHIFQRGWNHQPDIYIYNTYIIYHICNIHRDLIAISRRVAKAWVQHTHKGSFYRGENCRVRTRSLFEQRVSPKSSDCSVNHIFFPTKIAIWRYVQFSDTSISSWLHSPLYYIILSPLLSHYPILHQGAPLSRYIILHPHDILLNYTN